MSAIGEADLAVEAESASQPILDSDDDEMMLVEFPESRTVTPTSLTTNCGQKIVDEAHSDKDTFSESICVIETNLVVPEEVQPTEKSRTETVYIEGRLRDKSTDFTETSRQDLQNSLASRSQVFELGEDLLANADKALITFGGSLYDNLKLNLEFLKIVEYLGPKSDVKVYDLCDVRVNLQVYALHRNRRAFEEGNDDDEFPQGDIMSLPHAMFDGKWEDLVFDTDIKGELLWLMTNMLRFSQGTNPADRDVNPLILLHGPPGTGKTTLCQGLAQKISIRLKESYDETLLVSIKTATLLSKYFSESAKQVDEIFTTLESMCEDDPRRFICVLIDEVESIAGCRQSSTDRGEAQDALRATNALITGLDRAKRHSNIVVLCTSNMANTLDAAFLDRCGLQLAVGAPTKALQYAILRGRIQKLITRGIITSSIILPPYRDAEVEFRADPQLSTSRLFDIVQHINSREMSARSLIQLPEQAVMRYLREDDCDLNMALGFIEQLVRKVQAHENETQEQQASKKRKRESSTDELYETVEETVDEKDEDIKDENSNQ